MEKQMKLFRSLRVIALGTLALLMIPFVAMQFTDGVDWDLTDFLIMGGLLFVTGLAYTLVTLFASSFLFRAGVAAAIGTTFLMIWANLAVGLIGSGPNTANLMYIAVILVVAIGIVLSRFTARGLERTMFAAVTTLILIMATQLTAGMYIYSGSSVIEVVGVNSFFAIAYLITGLLFRFIAFSTPHTEKGS